MLQQDPSPLDRLLVDAEQIDLERLVQLLDGKVGIDLKRNEVRLLPGVKSGTIIRQQIIYALLGQRALDIRSGMPEPTLLAPADLEKMLGVKGNSLRPEIKKLADADIIIRDDNGGYYIAGHSLDEAADILEGSRVH